MVRLLGVSAGVLAILVGLLGASFGLGTAVGQLAQGQTGLAFLWLCLTAGAGFGLGLGVFVVRESCADPAPSPR
ncbi:MAG: hypothetical protein EOO75_04360 [Myxococcales bacterium]|nr:MAG: hypothetical protein EOO75_04360 [Myxococcales bacterium]